MAAFTGRGVPLRSSVGGRVIVILLALLLVGFVSPDSAGSQTHDGSAGSPARGTSGDGWALRDADANPSDTFETTANRLELRITSPILYDDYTVFILDPDGRGTAACPLIGPCMLSMDLYDLGTGLKFATDCFWWIAGNSRDLGTYTVRICSTAACDSVLGETTFDLVVSTARFRSVGAQDGWVLESSENSGLGGRAAPRPATVRLGDDLRDRQYRSILSFDTSGLPNDAVVTTVTLRLRREAVVGTNPFRTHRPLYADIRKGFFGTTIRLESGDFEAVASRNRVATFSDPPVRGWYTAVLSAAAHRRVNLKGPTQFRLRFAVDDNNDRGNDLVTLYSGDGARKVLRPELIVEYRVP